MKKHIIIGLAMSIGVLSFGALSVSAADSNSSMDTCSSKQAYQQYIQEASGPISELKNKDYELREQYSLSDYVDNYKINEIEADRRELKDKINAIAQKYGIPACSRS